MKKKNDRVKLSEPSPERSLRELMERSVREPWHPPQRKYVRGVGESERHYGQPNAVMDVNLKAS